MIFYPTKATTIGTGALALLALTASAQAQSRRPHSEPPPRPFSLPFPQQPRQLPPCEYDGQIITLTLNTGTPSTLGSADPIWTVNPGFTAYSTATVAPWLANQPTAKWIQPAVGGTPVQLIGTATYVYATQFSTPVDPYFYNSITITGKFAGDDSALLTLNGGSLFPTTFNCPSISGNNTCFHVGKSFTASGYQRFARTGSFVNLLTIQVDNSNGLYSGLFVQATVKAICSKCTSPAPPVCGGNPSTC